jgi:hypothetical protein
MTDAHTQSSPSLNGPAIPPDLLLRRDRHLRFERGGIVYATDGRIGVLRQVVVDEVAGEVVELIVQLDHTDQTLVLPPEVVDKTAGSAIFLVTTREATPRHGIQPPAHPTRLVKVDPKSLGGRIRRFRSRAQQPRRAIARVGKDFVETPPLPSVEQTGHRTAVLVPGAD